MVLDLDLPGGFFFSPWLTGTGAYLQPLCLCFSDEGLCVCVCGGGRGGGR